MECMFCNHRVATYLLTRLGGVARGMGEMMEKDGRRLVRIPACAKLGHDLARHLFPKNDQGNMIAARLGSKSLSNSRLLPTLYIIKSLKAFEIVLLYFLDSSYASIRWRCKAHTLLSTF